MFRYCKFKRAAQEAEKVKSTKTKKNEKDHPHGSTKVSLWTTGQEKTIRRAAEEGGDNRRRLNCDRMDGSPLDGCPVRIEPTQPHTLSPPSPSPLK